MNETDPAQDPRKDSSYPQNVLTRCGALAELDGIVLDALLARCTEQRFEAGEVLVRQGEQGESLLFLVEGRAVATVVDDTGKRLRVGAFEPDAVVGEMALLTGNPRMASITAEERGVALVLQAEDFHELVRAHPELAVVLTHMVAERLGKESVDGLGGKVVDRYRISRCLGRGGMAIVYEAQELESGRTVALKMMSHRLVYEPTALSRFQREADVLLALEHANIAQVFRRFPGYRTHFIAMEFCDGGDLLRLIRRGFRPGEKETRRLVGQLAAGLAYLHSCGVVHRDIKPSNVLVTRSGVLKLADFGLATDLPAWTRQPLITPTGAILGTPNHMAPEQMDGQPTTSRSDVYALGCVLLELLTGKQPFDGTGLLEILDQKRSLALPARKDLGPGGISRKLYSILRDCLACDPERRRVDLAALARWSGPLTISPTLFAAAPRAS